MDFKYLHFIHSAIQSTNLQVFTAFLILQNGNWADQSCDEQHGYICMKQSSTESTGDEINIDSGCNAVS